MRKTKVRKLKKPGKSLLGEKKERVVYKKQQCKFVKKNGKRCRRYAVGSSTLCRIHGGNPIAKDALVSIDDVSINQLENTKFDPKEHPMLYLSCAKEGMSLEEIASVMHVLPNTLRKWSETYKEFAYVFELGEAMHEAWYIRAGKANLMNPRFQSGVFKWLTTNKLGYAEKTESANVNMNKNVGVLLVPEQMSMDDWEKENIDEEVIDVEVTKTTKPYKTEDMESSE